MCMVEKGMKNLETVRMIRDREWLLHRDCINRPGLFILEEKLRRGRNRAGFDCMSQYKC